MTNPHTYIGSRSYSFLGEELTCIPDTFIDIEDENDIEIPTTNSIIDSNDLPLEFVYKGVPGHYILLGNSSIHIKARILYKDGNIVPRTVNVTPINLLGQALFNQGDLYLNEEIVTKNNGQYAEKSYIGTVIAYNRDAKLSWLENELYYEDSPGDYFDSFIIKPTFNTGLIIRNNIASDSKIIDMVIKPHIDLFNQSRPIPPNVDIKLKFTRNPAEFCLMSDGLKDYKIQIISASLFLKVVKLNESVLLKHKEILENNGKMIYPIRRIQMQSFTLPIGVLTHSRPNIIHGQLPNRIVLCMTTNVAHNGTYKKNPFRFSPFGLRKANLIVNGKSVPSRPYIFNFNKNDNKGLEFTRAFKTLSTMKGPNFCISGNGITRKMFEDGYTMIPFILNSEYSSRTMSIRKEGTVQLELEFDQPLTEVINVILYIEFENIITIGKHGEINIDY